MPNIQLVPFPNAADVAGNRGGPVPFSQTSMRAAAPGPQKPYHPFLIHALRQIQEVHSSPMLWRQIGIVTDTGLLDIDSDIFLCKLEAKGNGYTAAQDITERESNLRGLLIQRLSKPDNVVDLLEVLLDGDREHRVNYAVSTFMYAKACDMCINSPFPGTPTCTPALFRRGVERCSACDTADIPCVWTNVSPLQLRTTTGVVPAVGFNFDQGANVTMLQGAHMSSLSTQTQAEQRQRAGKIRTFPRLQLELATVALTSHRQLEPSMQPGMTAQQRRELHIYRCLYAIAEGNAQYRVYLPSVSNYRYQTLKCSLGDGRLSLTDRSNGHKYHWNPAHGDWEGEYASVDMNQSDA